MGRDPINIDEYFAKIEPYLKIGLSVHKACMQANVPERTVYDYIEKNDDFRRKVEIAQEHFEVMVKSKSYELIKDGDGNHIRFILKRKFRDEYGDNIDITSGGEKIQGYAINIKRPEDDSGD